MFEKEEEEKDEQSGGRGLMSAEDTVQLESMNMQKYLQSKNDTLSLRLHMQA